MVCAPLPIANWTVQVAVQTLPFASSSAWRSEPAPLSLVLVTMTVLPVIVAVAVTAVLSAALGSVSAAVAEALAVAVPTAPAVVVMLMVTLLPARRLATLQVTVPALLLQVAPVAPVKVTFGGRTSVMVSVVAVDGPLFVVMTV